MSQCWSCSVGVSSDREFCAKCEESLLAEREARRPLPVSTLLSARHETIHRDPGAARAARSVKVSDKLPTIDDVRAAAEKAKAFDPNDPYLCTRARCSKSAMLVLKADTLCDKCLGAKRAVEDISGFVDDALMYLRNHMIGRDQWAASAVLATDRAARIASYFASEPNPVSECRDVVCKFLEAGK